MHRIAAGIAAAKAVDFHEGLGRWQQMPAEQRAAAQLDTLKHAKSVMDDAFWNFLVGVMGMSKAELRTVAELDLDTLKDDLQHKSQLGRDQCTVQIGAEYMSMPICAFSISDIQDERPIFVNCTVDLLWEPDSDSSVDSDTSDEEAAAKKERRAQKAKATSAEDGQKSRSDGITSGAGEREGDSEETSSGWPGEECEASFVQANKALPNPMEGGRPPVQFGEDAPAGTSLPSSEFLAQRRAHYDEGAALRSKHSEDGASPGGLSDMDKSAAANPMDPTEPHEAAVSFKVETVSGDHQGSGTDAWRSKRNAHYRDMAAAFRSKPPVSDGDSEDSS
ncbi:hypothetical protein AK812_SmicGene41313 [Symbiodinium microadriaticum]|uniref:Uncharacterized protein n=1 Tax=Symbiodinium microadriaticum TaxID=2951 RepID=A0A1Q9C6F6_SYMMI|nr:hypothetical protein AK812_SmicGene41313 [Symbiodinium microadriaticum]